MTDPTYRDGSITTKSRDDEDTFAPRFSNNKLDDIDKDDFASVMTDPTYRGGAIATKSRDDQDTYAPTYENEENEDDVAYVMTDPTYRGGAIATNSRGDEDTYASIHENERSYDNFASVMTDPTYRGGAMATKSGNDEDTYASIYEDETSSRSRFSNQSNGVQSHYSQLSKYQLSRNRNREGRMNDRDAHSEESEKAGSFVGRFIYREDSQSVDSSLPSTRGVENSWYTGEDSVQKSSVTNSSTIESSRGFSEGSIQNSFNSNNSSINDASKTSYFTRESDQTHTQPCNSLRSLVSTEDLSQSASHSVSTYSKLTQSESSLLSNRKKYVSHINSTKRSGSIASFSTATSEPSFATKTNQEDDLLSVKNISTTVSDPLLANERKVSNDFKHEIGDTSVALLRPNDTLSQSHQLEEKDSSSLIPISQELFLPQTSLIKTTPQASCSIFGEGLNRRASFPIVGHDRKLQPLSQSAQGMATISEHSTTALVPKKELSLSSSLVQSMKTTSNIAHIDYSSNINNDTSLTEVIAETSLIPKSSVNGNFLPITHSLEGQHEYLASEHSMKLLTLSQSSPELTILNKNSTPTSTQQVEHSNPSHRVQSMAPTSNMSNEIEYVTKVSSSSEVPVETSLVPLLPSATTSQESPLTENSLVGYSKPTFGSFRRASFPIIKAIRGLSSPLSQTPHGLSHSSHGLKSTNEESLKTSTSYPTLGHITEPLPSSQSSLELVPANENSIEHSCYSNLV